MMLFLLAALGLLLPAQQPKKYEIQQPKGKWQVPGEIQQPKGPWQVPKGIQAIKVQDAKCEQRLVVGADALFAYDQAKLSKDAEETLQALGPLLKKNAGKPVTIEGHTDAHGSDAYNQTLSEQRAAAVQGWLVAKGYLHAGESKTAGFGRKKPAAPNTKPDGADDPEGRAKNRRVEVVRNTCK